MDSKLTEYMINATIQDILNSWNTDDRNDYVITPVHPEELRWINYCWNYSKPKRRKQFEKAWRMMYES